VKSYGQEVGYGINIIALWQYGMIRRKSIKDLLLQNKGKKVLNDEISKRIQRSSLCFIWGDSVRIVLLNL